MKRTLLPDFLGLLVFFLGLIDFMGDVVVDIDLELESESELRR